VRAFYVDPRIASMEDIKKWEAQISDVAGQSVSITDPEVARVYVYREQDQDNLSVRAVEAKGVVTSDELYDLFVPIAPPAAKPLVKSIQRALGIQEVIAVPFFLETATDDGMQQELVGNLFAAKRGKLSEHDIMLLAAFGRQAAAAIGSERQRLQIEIMQALIYRVQTSLHSESKIFNWIAEGVVSDLGYIGAMVAPYDASGALPVHALYIDPQIATVEDVRHWEDAISEISGKVLSLTDPQIARVYVDQDAYAENLSARAAKAGEPVTSASLYDLFTPVVPVCARALVEDIQDELGIRHVIAVPFFLETPVEGKLTRTLVGNLFAATRSLSFKQSEIALLRTFGEQAAAAIHNARLYRKAEEQRHAAQMFGRLAFSAATSVHALRNHIGTVNLYLELLQRLSPREQQKKLENIPTIKSCIDKTIGILDTLSEPWHQISDDLTDVNSCLQQAFNQGVPAAVQGHAEIDFSLSDRIPLISASPDMLTEAFRILMKNAFEAINEKGPVGELHVKSLLNNEEEIEVLIEDTGIGIRPENLERIFNIGWGTKKTGMGFGLFWTRDYIEGLGGRIDVQSVWHEGTAFCIYLPTSQPQAL